MPIFKPHFLTLVCSFLLLNGCAVHQASDDTERGLTVSQIYHQSMDEMRAPIPHYHIKTTSNAGYIKTIESDNVMPFKPLDNPLVPIYIYPHAALIGDEQIIKPGYTTAFFLYKQNQFALASEQY